MNDSRHLDDAYMALRQRLLAYGRRMNLSEADAADAIHDGYLRLHGTEQSTIDEAKGKLTVAVRNLLIDRLRMFGRRSAVSLDKAEETLEPEEPDFMSDDLIRAMRSVLPPLQLKIMELLAVEEMEYVEIAERLNMSEGAVRTNVSRARKTLKEKLRNER